MEELRSQLKKNLARDANKRLHSDMHVLADEISSFFNERKKFGMYLGVIKRVGVSKAREIFSIVKSDVPNVENPRKLFMWLTRNPGKKPEDADLAKDAEKA